MQNDPGVNPLAVEKRQALPELAAKCGGGHTPSLWSGLPATTCVSNVFANFGITLSISYVPTGRMPNLSDLGESCALLPAWQVHSDTGMAGGRLCVAAARIAGATVPNQHRPSNCVLIACDYNAVTPNLKRFFWLLLSCPVIVEHLQGSIDLAISTLCRLAMRGTRCNQKNADCT